MSENCERLLFQFTKILENQFVILGRDITDADLIKAATAVGTSEAGTRDTIEQINTALSKYKILH